MKTMKALLLAFAVLAGVGYRQMGANYLKVSSTFSTMMHGRRSLIDTTVYYTDGVTIHGDTVCAIWLPLYFDQFEGVDRDTIFLTQDDF